MKMPPLLLTLPELAAPGRAAPPDQEAPGLPRSVDAPDAALLRSTRKPHRDGGRVAPRRSALLLIVGVGLCVISLVWKDRTHEAPPLAESTFQRWPVIPGDRHTRRPPVVAAGSIYQPGAADSAPIRWSRNRRPAGGAQRSVSARPSSLDPLGAANPPAQPARIFAPPQFEPGPRAAEQRVESQDRVRQARLPIAPDAAPSTPRVATDPPQVPAPSAFDEKPAVLGIPRRDTADELSHHRDRAAEIEDPIGDYIDAARTPAVDVSPPTRLPR